MFLNRLKITNVRNHKNSVYDISDETIFIGENGSGKTTVLESAYLILAMRCFKKQPISNVITFNEIFLRIEAEVSSELSAYKILLKYDGKKSLFIDDNPVEKISDFIYDFPIACYTPDFQGVLSLSQAERRNFIDRFIFYTDKAHIDDIKFYNRYIVQKATAFGNNIYDTEYLHILNEKIILLSKSICEKRLNFVKRVNRLLESIYADLEFPMENVYISYKTNVDDLWLLENEKLKRRCDYGAHRDKVEMVLDSKVIEKFSSIGQKKTFILLCLYCSLKDVEIKRKISIITLLDDFEATLDKKRASFLKALFSNGRQTIFTGVENARLDFKNTINL